MCYQSMENALKIKVLIKSILFCKYLRNGSSDLYEILCGGQLLSCEPMFQISERSLHKCARTSCKRALARFIASARVYDFCARIFPRISMKFENKAHNIVIDHHIKFHKDPSFHYGDIYKTILTFWKLPFSRHFPYFDIYKPQKSSKINNYWMLMDFFGN